MRAAKPNETAPAGGRQRLIDAALRLAARKSAVSSLGLRELSREAGLNPNTFYRHFADLDALSIAIVEQLAEELRKRRQEARENAADFATLATRSLESYFEFAAEQPEAFIVGFRELSLQTPASHAIRRVMDEIADELADITRRQGLLTDRDIATVREIASFVVSGLFLLAIEYIERKAQRRAILAKANRYVALLITGAFAEAQKPNSGTAPALRGGASSGTAPALRGGASSGTAPALRGGASSGTAPALRGGASRASTPKRASSRPPNGK